MARFVMGLIVGGVLVMGIARGQGGDGGEPMTTPAPVSWVVAPMEAREGTFLAEHGYCRRGREVRQLFDIAEEHQWRSTHYRCRSSR